MRILAIDTAAALCAACVYDTQAGEIGRQVLDLGKGHAEHLIGVIDAALADAGLGHADIDRIAVCVGPGSFTGVRVGVATARGLALALGKPAVGVSTLEALAEEARSEAQAGQILVRIEAGRGQVYVASYGRDGAELLAPAVVSLEEAGRLADGCASAGTVVAGRTTADIVTYARLAVDKSPRPPKPLYLRDADARRQEAFALPRRKGP